MTWEGSSLVATPSNVPTSVIPDWITTVYVQVASGLGPPGAPLTNEKIAEMRAAGLSVQAWAWCAGPTQPGGGEPEEEAAWHALCARSISASVFIANLESFYDAGGNQSDPRYAYPRRYLSALDWDGPLGLTTTPAFASDMTDWIRRGAVFMPQAFPLENAYGINECMEHALAWGWPVWQIRPLVQCYVTGMHRPDPEIMSREASEWGVGVTPYVIEQACDVDGLAWLDVLQEAIIRPTSGENGGGDVTTIIGSQHGVTAACNRLRDLDPKGTKLQKQADKWPAVESLGPDVNSYGAWDKLERSLKILCQDHDAA